MIKDINMNNNIEKVLKSKEQTPLSKEDEAFIISSKDEIYKNVLKKVGKYSICTAIFISIMKLWKKFLIKSVLYKSMVIGTIVTSGLAPIVTPKIIDYITINKETTNTSNIKQKPVQIKKKITTKQQTFVAIKFFAATVPKKELNEFIALFNSYRYSTSKTNFYLSIQLGKQYDFYNVQIKLSNAKNNKAVKIYSKKYIEGNTKAKAYCRQIMHTIYKTYIK